MYRLGLQLTVKGGREALVRLLLTMAAVAIGATILLSVFADFHAFQKTSQRPSWESTVGTPVTSVPNSASNSLFWNYSENIYKGQFIEQLDVASLGPDTPTLPGVSRLPGPGQFYVSPALADLLRTVPRDELGDRFPGRQVGTIGEAALSFPTELAIYIGRSPSQMAGLHGTIAVTHIATQAQLQGTTNIYKDAFGIGALAILFPLLILVNTATRLSATRREERYAAMRLIGATPHQINIIASVDAIVGSLLGALVGSLIFLAIRPVIADISFSGVKFFPNYVTPTVWGYAGIIVIVPIVAAIASLLSLRRVKISPLGVSRKTTPPKPRVWRIIPLVVGVPFFIRAAVTIAGNTQDQNRSPLPIFVGFLLIMVGIVLSGSWLTLQVTKIVARYARTAPALLAARRLSDNPKAAFRTVSGLVLAVFVGSVVAVVVPAINQAQNPPGETSLSSVMRVSYNNGPGLTPQAGAALVSKLDLYPGTAVVPIYYNPAFLAAAKGNRGPSTNAPDNSVIGCSSVQHLSSLGACPAGVTAVTFDSNNLLSGDNPLFIYQDLPAVGPHNPPSTENLNKLSLSGVLIKANNPNTLEQIRTYLTVYNSAMAQIGPGGGKGGNSLSAWQMGEFEPETIGEVAAIRNNDDSNVGRAVLAVVALTLITAGCSLAVTVGGSLVERRRPFTLLRVSGVSLGMLYKVVLLEAALPLIVVSVVAAAIGLSVGTTVINQLLKSFVPHGVSARPSVGYYITLGIGLIIALGLVGITLPLLKRMTKPEDARFE